MLEVFLLETEYYSVVCIYHILLSHSSMDGLFVSLTITHRAAINVNVKWSVQIHDVVLLVCATLVIYVKMCECGVRGGKVTGEASPGLQKEFSAQL